MAIDYEKIYSTDLVYVPDCWRLCGDAYCCNFRRYKQEFKIIEKHPSHEVPLLPGEYEFLRAKNLLSQFQDYDHRTVNYQFGDRCIQIDLIESRRPGCACDHATRTTVCRLYPLLPVFDEGGRLVGTDRVGPYDIMEDVAGMEHACQVRSVPVHELEKLLTITTEIARDPLALFYISAYRVAQDHLRERLQELMRGSGKSVFGVFETGLLLSRLIDNDRLRQRLTLLADSFDRAYGAEFSQGLRGTRG